ncbi:hypothetical protein GGG16DRAFT_108602 [Schizophyllum commune]
MSSYAPELSYYPLTSDVVDVLKNVIIETGLAYIAYGMQAALTLAAVRILLRREARARFMLVAIVGLFVVSTLAVVTDIEYYMIQFPSALGTSPEDMQAMMNGLDIVGVVTVRLSYVVSDGIVVWRAWIIWPDCRPIRWTLLLCICGSTVGAIVNCYWDIKSITTYERIPMTRTLVMTVPLLFTNIVATTFIAVKVWQALYIAFESNDPGAGFTPMQVLSVVIPFITGLYPPVIVIITLQSNKTQSLLQSAQISHALRFAGLFDPWTPKQAPSTDRSTRRYVTESAVNFNIMPLLNKTFTGVQSILLFIAAWFILSRRNGRSRFMLGALVALFSCSSMVVIAHEVSYVVQTPSEVGTASKQAIKPFILRVDVLLAVAQRFNFVVSDIIVAWRAWVIWSESRVARGILAVSVGSGLVGAIIECVWVLERLITTNTTISKPMSLMQSVPILFTNIVATVLVGLKVWYYRRDVKGNLGLSTKRTQVEKVLTMLVESGSVYCLIWLAHLIAQSVIGAAGFTPTRLVDTALHSISAIYPTVVVLIAMHSNTTQTLLSSQISHALNFAGGADVQNASAVEENIGETQDNGELGSTTSSSA